MMAAVRDTAVVRPVGVVDGRTRRRKPRPTVREAKVWRPTLDQVNPLVRQAVRQARRPGEVVAIVSTEVVYLVTPKQYREGAWLS